MQPPIFLVCGEALFDLFCDASDGGAPTMHARAAGSPFNVAIGLARLQQRVAFCGGLSSGLLGQRLRAALEGEGVDCALSVAIDAPTTLSLIETDATGVPRYTFYGAGGADRLLQEVPPLPESIRAIQLGSYTLVAEPTASALRALVEREHGRRLIACDVNLRLGVEPSLERWREAVEAMARRASVMKASDEDLALLHPGEDPQRIARRWLAAGCALVVLTRGARGVAAWRADAAMQVEGRRVEVVDTVGAGDAFQAALLCGLAERQALTASALAALPETALGDVLAFANRAAAIVCARRGADPARRSEL